MSPSAPPPVTVVVGDEEFLVARAVAAEVAAVRTQAPDAELVELAAVGAGPQELAEAMSLSLFSEHCVVLLQDAEQSPKALAADVLHRAGQPDAGVTLIVCHAGGARGRSLLDGLRAAGARIVECPALRWPEDRERFVVAEVRAAGGSIDRGAAAALIAAVGNDPRDLAAAGAQLVSDCGARIDEEAVARYHSGRADAGSFTIADRAVEGDVAGALELLRWARSVGQSPAGMTSALAMNLRTIGLVAGVRGTGAPGSPQAVAAQLRMPVWRVRRAQNWLRGWRPEGLAAALRAVALADAEVKGAAADADFAIQRAVLAVAAARAGR